MVDVGDRAGWRHRLQVLVVDAVAQDVVAQLGPVGLGRDRDAETLEQGAHEFGARGEGAAAVGVLVEIIALAGRLGVRRIGETAKRRAVLDGQRVRGAVGVVGDRHEIHVGEVERFLGTILDALAGEETVQVHLSQADRVPFIVRAADRGHRVDARVFGHRRQGANRRLDGAGQARVHRLGDVQRAEVAGHVAPDVRVGQVLVVGARLLHLQDFGAQVRHRDAPGDRVRAVHRVLEHDVRVAGFELDFGQRREELARVDIGFPDAVVGHHLVVMLGDGNVGERLTLHALRVIRAEQRHLGLLLGQLERDVRDYDAQRQ